MYAISNSKILISIDPKIHFGKPCVTATLASSSTFSGQFKQAFVFLRSSRTILARS